jgi:protein involved in polysaccharide export with SLBB domain
MSIARASVLVVVALLIANFAIGQSTRSEAGSDIFGDIDKTTARGSLNMVQPKGVALESIIDPATYYVGPSDVFSINIWISPPLSFLLTVTPEGTLIIPTVGEVRVADMRLADAKEKVLGEIRKKYTFGASTMTLASPRPVVVTVTGSVLYAGTIILNATDRVEKAIQEANKAEQTRKEDVGQVQRARSSRNITLRRRDGTVSRVDLKMYYATKADSLNPYLREGDIIFVPSIDLGRNVIGVYGAVNSAGAVEFVQGDSITDAIRLAFGFTRFSLTETVELSRLGLDGETMTTSQVDLKAIHERRTPNIALESGDRIIVKPRIDLRGDFKVSVGGEVLYPGFYPITKNQTRISEVIQRAGGFTEFAWLEGAELNHRVPADISLERLMSLRAGVSSEDSANYLVETELRLQKEVVNVDFDQLFSHHDSTQDVIVHDGDYIYVPSKRATIYVFGQVVSAGHIPFVEGEKFAYYVRKAGGYTDRAREDDVRVVKGKTKQWLDPRETVIEEGDYVWVPKVVERPFGYYMNTIGQTASVIAVAVSIVLLVIQINK